MHQNQRGHVGNIPIYKELNKRPRFDAPMM